MLRRRSVLSLPAAWLPATAFSESDWPTRPVRIVVPFATGGSTDISTRLLAPRIAQSLGQQIVIENRSGAGGTLGADAVAKSPPDGSVFLMGTVSTQVLAVGLRGDRLPYDPERDFVAVAPTVMVPICITVHPSLGVTDLAGLIALIKAQPGKVAYGTGGAGGSAHIGAVAFLNAIGGTATHVPYRGSAPMLVDLLSGQVKLCFDTPALLAPHHDSGRLRCLAVATQARSPLLPGVPTTAEAGLPNYRAYSWFGLFAPAGTPATIVAKMNEAVRSAVLDPANRARLEQQDLPPIMEGSPAEFARFLRRELESWVPVVRASGATAN